MLIQIGHDSIFTKLKEYPYEFEIDSGLRLASINGIQVSDTSKNEEIENLKTSVENFQNQIISQQETITTLQEKIQKLEETVQNNSVTGDSTLLFEGSATAGNITFLNGHSIDEFKTIRFLYGTPGNLIENDISTTTWSDIILKNFGLGLYGYGTFAIDLCNLSKTGFSISGATTYAVYKVYGVK